MSITKLPDIYFLPEWGRLFQDRDKGRLTIFDFKHESGQVYYQFIKRRINDFLDFEDYYDIITPYGFNGPVIQDVNPMERELLVQEFNKAFEAYCKNENIVAEYVRFNPWMENHLDFQGIYSLKYNNYTLFTDLTCNDFFHNEFHTKTRNIVRRAVRSGVNLEFDYSGSTILMFCKLYELTVKKNQISDYYQFEPSFLQELIKVLGEKQFIINAIYAGNIISSAIFLSFNDYLHYFLVANNPNYFYLNANSLILYGAANWGVQNKKRQLHLGGAFSKELFSFKHQFTRAGKCDFYVGSKIRNEYIYNQLVTLRLEKGELNDTTFFPRYRG
jgi:serine/alanine adding enzyme